MIVGDSASALCSFAGSLHGGSAFGSRSQVAGRAEPAFGLAVASATRRVESPSGTVASMRDESGEQAALRGARAAPFPLGAAVSGRDGCPGRRMPAGRDQAEPMVELSQSSALAQGSGSANATARPGSSPTITLGEPLFCVRACPCGRGRRGRRRRSGPLLAAWTARIRSVSHASYSARSEGARRAHAQ